MPALSEAEIKALQVVVLATNVKKESYGLAISQVKGIGPSSQHSSKLFEQVYAPSPDFNSG